MISGILEKRNFFYQPDFLTMNIKCIICSDLFVASAEIAATKCGHLFHFACLLQWLERSKSCPQCRNKTRENAVYRVYINEEEPGILDQATLQNEVDHLRMEDKFKKLEVQKLKEALQVSNEQALGLRLEVKDLEDKIRAQHSTSLLINDKLKQFKKKSIECDKLRTENLALRKKNTDLENVQKVINGSQAQVSEMLQTNCDTSSLKILVTSLKKELVESHRKNKQVQVLLRDTETKLQNKSRESMEALKENAKLLHEMEIHKNYKAEVVFLKDKIKELEMNPTQTNSSESNGINRLLLESPVAIKQVQYSSPSVTQLVSQIKDSASPYLPIHSASVGLSGILNSNHLGAFKKQPILKNPSTGAGIKNHPSFSSYDGFGGHSRDEHLPSVNIKKRPMSSTATLGMAKARKFELQTKQKSLNKFFGLGNVFE